MVVHRPARLGALGTQRSHSVPRWCARKPDAGCQDCVAVMSGTIRTWRWSGLRAFVQDRRGAQPGVWAARTWPPPAPAGTWIVLEDADRLTESANNVLLKSIEEPASGTVWLLCAPSVEDLLPTVRSRCQVVGLRTPATDTRSLRSLRRRAWMPVRAAFAAPGIHGSHRSRPRAGHHRIGAQPSARRPDHDARPRTWPVVWLLPATSLRRRRPNIVRTGETEG